MSFASRAVTSPIASVRHLAALVALAGASAFAGCGSSASPSDAGADAAPSDHSVPDGGTDAGDGCVPTVCEVTACGTMDDGCGGTVACTAGCDCQVDALEDCPQRPCEVAAGCSASGACEYEPVTCSFERCECPAGMTCADSDPRLCGATCGTEVCDPQPTTSGGIVSYANQCVDVVDVGCGLCGLGQSTCSQDGLSLDCNVPAIPGIVPATANCDGSSAAASVVFFDPAGPSASPDGSREHPFLDFDQAVAAAVTRGARAVLVGGGPRIERATPVSVTLQVSVVGGFTGWPTWQVSSARPRFVVTTPVTPGGANTRRIIALRAAGIDEETLLHHVAFETVSLVGTDGATNAGAFITDSPSLVVRDVVFTVGAAAGGQLGAHATAPTAGGGDGGPGANGYNDYMCPTIPMWEFTSQGGAGGAACGGSSPGGAGGDVIGDAPTPFTGLGVMYGEGGDPGANGGGAGGPAWTASTTAQDGQPGAARSGRPATPPAGTPGLATAADGFPYATGHGLPGSVGAYGLGGGGGGAAWFNQASAFPCINGNMYDFTPGAGGGGGGGGCGGNGGQPGACGGWVLGMVVHRSAGLTLVDVAVTLGAAGVGGGGGNGSAGSDGGRGNIGGFPGGGNAQDYYAGRGGDGGRGQDGGHGSAGATGNRVLVQTCGGAVTLTDVTEVISSNAMASTTAGCP
jgi:hypothetical protein